MRSIRRGDGRGIGPGRHAAEQPGARADIMLTWANPPQPGIPVNR